MKPTDLMDASQPFPPEAYAYDSDITEDAIRAIKAKASAVLSQEEWVVIDGVKRDA